MTKGGEFDGSKFMKLRFLGKSCDCLRVLCDPDMIIMKIPNYISGRSRFIHKKICYLN